MGLSERRPRSVKPPSQAPGENRPFAELPFAFLREGTLSIILGFLEMQDRTVFSPKMHEQLKPYSVDRRVFPRKVGIPRIWLTTQGGWQ